MRIGIDIDDTMCCTSEIVKDRLEKYAIKEHMDPLDIMNNEELKSAFFSIYLEDIYSNVEIKKNDSEVLKRLKSKGNEIYLITARSNYFVTTVKNNFEIIERWMKEHNIEIDGIVASAYGEEKADVCKRYNIDLMIDDDPYNYQKIISSGIKCVLFDDKEKYELKDNYVSNWLELEKYIERNR